MADTTDTARARSRVSYVLVVHDAEHRLSAISGALRKELVVRECFALHEAFAELAARSYACVIVRASGAVAADFLRRIRDSIWRDVPIIFVCGADASDRRDLERERATCVSEQTPPDEVLALVRAVRT